LDRFLHAPISCFCAPNHIRTPLLLGLLESRLFKVQSYPEFIQKRTAQIGGRAQIGGHPPPPQKGKGNLPFYFGGGALYDTPLNFFWVVGGKIRHLLPLGTPLSHFLPRRRCCHLRHLSSWARRGRSSRSSGATASAPACCCPSRCSPRYAPGGGSTVPLPIGPLSRYKNGF